LAGILGERFGVWPGVVAIAVASGLWACAGAKSASDDGGRAPGRGESAAPGVSLEGTSWVLADLGGRAPLAGGRPTARFESGEIRGTDGCNRYSLPFTAAGATLGVGAGGASTQMACPPEVMEQARAFRDALSSAREFRIVDGRLELRSSTGGVLAVFAAQPTTLVGAWEVIAFNNGREAVVGVLEAAPMEITFDSAGGAAGSAGCNRFTATFEATGEACRFGPAATTRRLCPGEGVMEQERAFLNALASVATMRMEGDQLEFRTAEDALAMMLRRKTGR